jgi:hypothetical protein
MGSENSLGFGRPQLPGASDTQVEYVIVQRPLDRILAFTGRSIDDVVDNPIAKNHVLCFYKLHRWVERESEISEMERMWNPLGRRT